MSKKEGSLRDKLLILLATAVLTGLAVPLVTSFVQSIWADRQKTLEADLMRQGSLLADQDALLKRVQHQLFAFRMKIVKPAWYQYKDEDADKYRQALADFDAAGWQFHEDMHQELTNVRRLASPTAYDAFFRIYSALGQLDNRLVALSRNPAASRDEWENLHLDANKAADDIQAVVILLAGDFTLKPFEETGASSRLTAAGANAETR